MATVAQSIIEPNREAIKAHLQTLFEPAQSEYPDGLVELRYGPPEDLTHFAYFNLKPEGLEEAAAFAVNRNNEGQNVYVGVNPRRPTTNLKRAATAADVEIAFFHFADIDKAGPVEAAASRYAALPPTMTVTTGTIPNKRPHLYWQLEEPTANMGAWSERQKGIAQTLEGDAVIDPPRIMRLGGTVNFPTQKKLGQGYKVEVSAVRTEFSMERPPVGPEQIAAVYPARASGLPANSGQLAAGQTTLSAMSRGTRIADLINACRSGDQWHNSMVRLVAHLATTGRTDAEILGLAAGITLPGYSIDQTLREMMTALRGARQKWNVPEPDDTVEEEEARREEADSVFSLLDLDELESLPPPTWLIHELIADHGLSIVYGDPGAGKSFVVLDMALRLAYGMDWHGTEAKQCGVLYIAGEGARGLGKRVTGWRKEHALEGADAPFLLLPVAVQILDEKERAKLCRTIEEAKARAGFPIGLVIIDTVSRAIAGQDENGQEAMSMFVGGCAEIQIQTGGAVIGVHHAGKDSSRGMRGSTVLLGACDASLKLTKDEGQRVTIEVEKQKDAEEAAPIYMAMKKVEWATGLGKEESTLVPVKAQAQVSNIKTLNRREVDAIFGLVADAWAKKDPWSIYPQAMRRGRYLPAHIATTYELSEAQAISYLSEWQANGYLKIEPVEAKAKAATGLRVIKMMEPN